MRDKRKYYAYVEKRKKGQTVAVDTPPDIELFTAPFYLFLDQATKTGYAVYDSESRLVCSGVLYKDATESVQAYGHGLVEFVEAFLHQYNIDTIFYEEVYDKENMLTTETLLYIKHKIQDMTFTREGLTALGLDHRRWKTELAKPEKFVAGGGSAKEKEQVAKFVSRVFPLVTMFSNDETDAIGMGIGVLMKQQRRGNFFDVTRYKKNLPIWDCIVEGDVTDENVREVVESLRKPFRTALEVGDIFEIPLDTRRRSDDTFRRFLSHRDSVVFMQIPKNYRYWGVMLLENGIAPSELKREDKSFTIIGCRKGRL
ncbi:hypothetical protein COD17_10385 [Bacillus thuringiensis]|nr:hypothetical protein COD17_10385 [Bacillus thuringiensis]